MVSDAVLKLLDVRRMPDGSVITIPAGDPDYVKGGRFCFEPTPIYVSDYETEYDDSCRDDYKAGGYELGHYITCVQFPYKLVIPPKSKSASPRLHMDHMVQCAIDFFHACDIGGTVAFLDLPDDEHAKGNVAACYRRLCDVPGLVTNLYYSGVEGSLRLLNRILPNRTVREAEEFYKQLCAAIKHRTDLHFKRERNVFAFKNGVAIRINVFARKPEDVIQMMPPITPEDHILASALLPVNYNPTVADSDLAIKITEGWSDTYKSDKWWRNMELNFSTPFLMDYDDKGVVINIAQGGAGMTTQNKLRAALIGSSSVVKASHGLDGLTKTGDLGTLVDAMVYLVDELPVGPVSSAALANLRSLSTGEEVDARVYFTQDTVPVGHFAIVLNTNHFPELPQREARRNAIARRFHVCQHHTVFDDASIDNPADRKKEPESIAKLLADEDALSCVLNWALEGASRVIVNRGYTYVEEDIAYLRRNLGNQDTISEFFENLGGIYGQNWGSPRLYRFGHGYDDEIILFPCWHDCETGIPISKVLDMSTDKACTGQILVSNCRNRLRMVNETAILYRLYADYCKAAGSTAVLSRKNFKNELLNTGYDEIRVVDPFGRRARIIVPAGTENSAAGFAEFLQAQRDEYANGGDAAAEPSPSTGEPTTLSPEISDYIESVIDTGTSRWSDVDAMAHEAGKPQIVCKWMHAFEDKTIDDIVAGNLGIEVDHDTLMSVLRVGIRAVQTANGFDERGVFRG